MPDLIDSLQSSDLGHLRIVAAFWGIELVSPDPKEALQELTEGMLNAQLVKEIFESLPAEACQACETLKAGQGRFPWQDFLRRHGKLRDIGRGKRDREQYHLSPISPVEMLYYRGFIARAFFETQAGLQEFAYIPEDLLPLLPVKPTTTIQEPGRRASPQERKFPQTSTDAILDDACTLLAALRMGWQDLPAGTRLSVPRNVLMQFLFSAGLIQVLDQSENFPKVQLEQVKGFLESSRQDALLQLVGSWLSSGIFNELRQIPGLIFEGVWMNDPLKTRHFILSLLEGIPQGKWWNLVSLVGMLKKTQPEFMRTAGEFDSWLIRKENNGEFLHGYSHWDDVEGSFIRYIITGPMFWLGLVDIARADEEGPIIAFRLTGRSKLLLKGQRPSGHHPENSRLHVASNGRITIPPFFPRAVRYLIARYSEWEPQGKDDYRYHLIVDSLKKAQEQGLRVSQLMSILEKYKSAPIPPSFARAMNRWELNGTEARLEEPVILRLSSREVLQELRKSKAARFLGEVLGPTTVVVKPGAREKVVAALGELGLLTDVSAKEVIMEGSDKNHE